MQRLNLPQTDLQVSRFCLGGSNFGVPLAEADTFRLLDRFVELGGNFVDTARVYAEWRPGGANASERTIGNWMKARGNRDQVVVATKGGHPRLDTMHISRLSRAELRSDIEDSLRYLQTDRIDLYWLHRDDSRLPVADILEPMNEQVQAGSIRYFGCSNWTVARIREANQYADTHGLKGFVANSAMWSLAEPNREAITDKTTVATDAADLAFHRESHLPLVPYTSQARGFFNRLAAGDLQPKEAKSYDNPVNRARFARVHELSQRHNTTISAIALSYLTSQPFPVIPIIGASHPDQLDDSLSDPDLVLSPDELAWLQGGVSGAI